MESVRKLKANRKLEGKPCGWCQAALALGDDAGVCNGCEAEHHAACWDAKGGCSRQGCANAPLKRLDEPVATAAAAPSPWSGYPQQPAQPAASAGASSSTGGGARPLQAGFKFCTNCGNQVLESTQICDYCNAILTPDGIYSGPTVNAPGAVASLVFGIVGLFICGLIFGILAIVKSREAKASIAFNPRYGGGGMATAGFVLGIIGLIGWAIIIVVRLSAMGGGGGGY
jgi:hypothetical protein